MKKLVLGNTGLGNILDKRAAQFVDDIDGKQVRTGEYILVFQAKSESRMTRSPASTRSSGPTGRSSASHP